MALTSDLISQFVKATNDKTPTQKESLCYGTVVKQDGALYVQLDGSEQVTPVTSTASVEDGNRVTVAIKDHTALITGNLSEPSASNTKVIVLGNKINEFDITIADKVSAARVDALDARVTELTTENATIKEHLTATDADIDTIEADYVTVTEKLTAAETNIGNLRTDKLDAAAAELTYATIENLDATNANIYNLEVAYGDFKVLATDKFTSIDASITDLNTKKLSAEDADLKYANIDFSNIGKAAFEYFYSKSGLIANVVVGDGTVTGNLVGVTIKGDLIEGNTIVADKLVIKGEDGLYYKLNTDGTTLETEQSIYNSLDGSHILANSITATKINVDDLVAFDATIGGFHITEGSLYSGVKETVDNGTSGIYLDSEGQAAVGDGANFIKYYKDTDGKFKLAILADSIVLATSNKSVADMATTEEVDHAQITADAAQQTADDAESLIKQLSDNIAMLVTDGNGTSLMTQTEEGWSFSTADIQKAVDATSEGLDSLVNEFGSTSNAVSVLQQAVDDLGILTDYIKIGTYEDEPCIELGESDSEFKLRITNTRIMFMEGSGIPAYFTNQSMHIKKAVIEEEFQQGGFVWKVRNNGNMGLVWKGVSN